MRKTLGHRIEAEVVLKSSDADMKKVANELGNLGFEVVAQGSRSISIAGPRALFETHFKLGEQTDPENETLKIPDEIREEVEGIYLQTPATYFQE